MDDTQENTSDCTEENTTYDKNGMSDGMEGTIDPVMTTVFEDSLVDEQRENSMSRELVTAVLGESDGKVVGWLHDAKDLCEFEDETHWNTAGYKRGPYD